MYTFLHARFKFTLQQYRNDNRGILVALSSGQDSLCLLKLLTDYLDQHKQRIQAIYIDHQWKDDSRKHVKHIVNMARFTQLPITIYQIRQLPMSENEARKIRYKIMIQHALKKQYGTIMTGHNSDDQTETVISNLFRGASLNGITNFTVHKRVKNRISIIRPFIHFSKTEIAWLCRLLYLPAWSDKTNYNLGLKRNRVRHELLPYIQNFFNPHIQRTLANFSCLCQEDNEYIKESTIKLYIKIKHARLASINLRNLKQEHIALQKRVIRLYFYYNFHKQISNRTTEWILIPENKQESKVLIIDQLALEIYRGWLYTGTAYF